MNKKSLSVGNVYVVKHGRDECKARLNNVRIVPGFGRQGNAVRSRTEYHCTKLSTGRDIVLRSPGRFLRIYSEMKP